MIDMVTRRKGDLVSMETQGDRVNIEFDMPSRVLSVFVPMY